MSTPLLRALLLLVPSLLAVKPPRCKKNHPTVGRIPSGAIVEREVPFRLPENHALNYRLRSADFTTVSRMADVVNGYFGQPLAHALDSGSPAGDCSG